MRDEARERIRPWRGLWVSIRISAFIVSRNGSPWSVLAGEGQDRFILSKVCSVQSGNSTGQMRKQSLGG